MIISWGITPYSTSKKEINDIFHEGKRSCFNKFSTFLDCQLIDSVIIFQNRTPTLSWDFTSNKLYHGTIQKTWRRGLLVWSLSSSPSCQMTVRWGSILIFNDFCHLLLNFFMVKFIFLNLICRKLCHHDLLNWSYFSNW